MNTQLKVTTMLFMGNHLSMCCVCVYTYLSAKLHCKFTTLYLRMYIQEWHLNADFGAALSLKEYTFLQVCKTIKSVHILVKHITHTLSMDKNQQFR